MVALEGIFEVEGSVPVEYLRMMFKRMGFFPGVLGNVGAVEGDIKGCL